jgi:hypothetical protein
MVVAMVHVHGIVHVYMIMMVVIIALLYATMHVIIYVYPFNYRNGLTRLVAMNIRTNYDAIGSPGELFGRYI